MKAIGIFFGVIIVIAAIVALSFWGTYNGMVTRDEAVKNTWAQVENALQRRYDLIPNLVNTVQGYAAHESAIFTEVAAARAGVDKASSIPDKISANNQLTGALSKLMMVVENYPDLKANQNFMALQDELAGTENRIAVERKRYNDAVMEYNLNSRALFTRFLVAFFGFDKEKVPFKADEGAKTAPKVNFGPAPAAASAPVVQTVPAPDAQAPAAGVPPQSTTVTTTTTTATPPSPVAAPTLPTQQPVAPAAPAAAPVLPVVPQMPSAPAIPVVPSAPVMPSAVQSVPAPAIPAMPVPQAPVPVPAPAPVAR